MALRTFALAGLALALFLTPVPGARQVSLPVPSLPPLPTPEALSRPVLTIGETAISWAEYTDWLTRMRGQLMASQYAGAFRLEQVAQQKGLTVTNEELEAEVQGRIDERVHHTFGGKHDAWVRSIGRLGRTEAGYLAQRRIEQRQEMIAWRLAALDRVVPEEKLVREWERAYGKGGRRYAVRLIKLPFVTPSLRLGMEGYERRQHIQAAREELRLEAEDLRVGLLAGDDFAETARKRSGDSDSAARGGVPSAGWNDTGWPASVITALAALSPGDLTAPLYARGGYWIIQVQGIDVTPFESVRAELEQLLIAAGPESDEIGRAVDEALRGLDAKVQPVLWALPEEGARVRALDEVVLFIDGVPVRRYEFVRWLNHLQGETMAPRFVEAWLIDKRALAEGVQVAPEALKQRVDDEIQGAIDEFFRGEREGWLARLESGGRDESMWRRELRLRSLVNMRVEEFVRRERTVPPAVIRGEYDERYGPNDRYYGVRVLKLSAQLPEQSEDGESPTRGRSEAAEDGESPTRGRSEAAEDGESPARGVDGEDAGVDIAQLMADLEARAAALHAEALAGADFATLCRTHSTDPETAVRGGLIEGGFRPHQWPEFISSAVVGLELGGISEPLKLGSSIHLLQLVEVRDVTFEGEAPALLRELMERRPADTEIAAFKNLETRSVPTRVLPVLFE